MLTAHDISLDAILKPYKDYHVNGIRMYRVNGIGWEENLAPLEGVFHVKQKIAELANQGAVCFNMALRHKRFPNMQLYPDFTLQELTAQGSLEVERAA